MPITKYNYIINIEFMTRPVINISRFVTNAIYQAYLIQDIKIENMTGIDVRADERILKTADIDSVVRLNCK